MTRLKVLASVVLCILLAGCAVQEEPVQEPAVTQTPTTEATVPATEAAEEETLPWNLLLVNPWNFIPKDFSVELTELEDGQSVDVRVYPDLQDMLEAMEADGLEALICSSFRTNEKQQFLYRRKVDYYLERGYSLPEADVEAGMWVAVPGTSEHETGLALDIIDESYPYLTQEQENTATQKWLMANSWRYGFILRYPGDKSGITGIHYEPWHYRYVGKDAAKEIFEQGICLEEYLKSLEN